MKYKLLPLISCLLFCLHIDSEAQIFSKYRKENELLKITVEDLRSRVDSLEKAYALCRRCLDSLREVDFAAGANPYGQEELYDEAKTDSLLREWYLASSEVFSKSYDVSAYVKGDSTLFSSDVPDSVFIRRLKDINSIIPLSFNDIVKHYCILYSERMKGTVARVLGLSQYYWPIFDSIFIHYGIPTDLKYLVVVESLLKPDATSRVGAKGIWQFMYTTARGYGLRIDDWVDERMDPYKSTVAAARFLKQSYAMFGDWYLAIASYNCGVGAVRRAIQRNGGKGGFWDIYDDLPSETRSYVPAFTGALYALKYYKEYGIVPTTGLLPLPVDTVTVFRNLHFGQIESVTGVDKSVLAALNPQYYQEVLPGNSSACALRLPAVNIPDFIAAGDSVYTRDFDKYFKMVGGVSVPVDSPKQVPGGRIVYKVKSGDVLGKIARRYGVTVSQIQRWNKLKGSNIRIGQKLVIYSRK